MALSDEELDRYARHIVLPQIGGAGQLRLKAASIAVVGAGGIGAGAIPALTGAGVGHLTIIDDDRVELSNLQRQPLLRRRSDRRAQSRSRGARSSASAIPTSNAGPSPTGSTATMPTLSCQAMT